MLKSFAPKSEPGKGVLVCQCRDTRAQFSRLQAQYPLKFIPTKAYADSLAAVYMLSYGGGVVSGDEFDISLTIEENAILLLMTQGNTKIFKDYLVTGGKRLVPATAGAEKTAAMATTTTATMTQGPSSIQHIVSYIESNATLLMIPDPVTSFRNSSFSSRQTFHLKDDTSQLVLLDWFTSGRLTRGEKWEFKHYSSKIDVKLKNKLVLRDHMVLDDDNKTNPLDHKTSYADQLAPYTCFATLVIVGMEKSIQTIEALAEERLMTTTKPRDMLWSVSHFLKGKGVLVRVAGMNTEQVRDFVKLECLGQGLKDVVGDGMFTKILM
ncbi:UreD urease accessory protein-domain-containing protein [Phascolomyces articulosus]|uniref:UreD urease accessory protein-domain-containing protein n=1 Tax=Phascolomyces articulosus TaxID=60185 RepID=A0AAD5PHT7_9FUNG|nr:UreD urease accessory protein-domain-containing protein [Phascolomyces articulosus]